MLEIIFDKDTTYQGSIMGIRKISNENEDVSEKKQTNQKTVPGGSYTRV